MVFLSGEYVGHKGSSGSTALVPGCFTGVNGPVYGLLLDHFGCRT